MKYARAFPADYDEWADILGDSSWNWNNVLPYFKKTEKLTDPSILNLPSSQLYHGFDGDIEVAGLDDQHHSTKTFLKAFHELGFKIVPDRSNPEEIGAFHNSYTIKDGKRHSSLTAMLNKVANNSNLHVMKNAFVTKILIKNNTAYGVKVLRDDEEWEFYAKKEVIVSAGVYNTPKLLMLLGIGPKWHLRQFGIDLVKNLPVGNNLQEQINTQIFLAAESEICPQDKDAMNFETLKYLFNRTGKFAMFSRCALEYASKNSLTPNVPDFAIFPACISRDSNFYAKCLQTLDFTNETCLHLDSINKKYEMIRFHSILQKPKSRGTVRLASADPLDNPVIRSAAFSKSEDLDSFPEVYQVAWSFMNTSYFKSKNAFIIDLGFNSCKDLDFPEDVKCEARSGVMSSGHGVGTAAMGTVLDSRMRVRGVRNLRVVDASAMPSALRGYTNAVAIMVAEKAADFIKEEYCGNKL